MIDISKIIKQQYIKKKTSQTKKYKQISVVAAPAFPRVTDYVRYTSLSSD